MLLEEGGGRGELGEGEAFVGALEGEGVDGFEAHGDLELGVGEEVAQVEGAVADEAGVRLDDDAAEGLEERGSFGVVGGGDGAGVEEAAAIVELDVLGGGEAGEGIGDLRGDSAGGEGVGEGVLPEVAHEAAPGTLAVGEEEGGDVDEAAGGGGPGLGFRLEEEGVGDVRVDEVARGAAVEDPTVAAGGGGRVNGEGGHAVRVFYLLFGAVGLLYL